MSYEILDNLEIEENRQPDVDDVKKLRILQGLSILQIIAAAISTALAWYEIESIMGTGPIGSLVGILVFRYARKLSIQPPILGRFVYGTFIGFRRIGMIIGLSAPIFSLFWLIAISMLPLNQTEAATPVTTALFIYTVILFLLVALLFGAYKLDNKSPKE